MEINENSSQEPAADPEGARYRLAAEPAPQASKQGASLFHCSCFDFRPPQLTPAPRSSPFRPTTAPHPLLPRKSGPTDPMTANAGSSFRSKGKSIRKLVLNRAVMVTVGSEGQRYGGSSQKATGRAREIMLECLPFLHPQPLLFT